jgi:hydroxypyruvate isomerase
VRSRSWGLRVARVNADAGERGHLNRPERHESVMRDVLDAVGLAARGGAPRVNVLVGIDHGGASTAVQLDRVERVLRRMAPDAAAAGVTLVVEALNRQDVPGYLLPNATSAAALVRRVDHPAVRVLYDAYHAAAAGCDPVAELRALSPLVDHVQYADHPGRGAWGTGSVDLAGIVRALLAAGYRGAVARARAPAGCRGSALGGPSSLARRRRPAPAPRLDAQVSTRALTAGGRAG